MKKPLLFFLLCLMIVHSSYAQKVTVESGKWISSSLDHIYFERGTVYFNFDGNDKHKPKYTIDNDTIKIVDSYTSSLDNFSKKRVEVFKFIIRYFDGKKLTIQAIGNNAVQLAGTKAMEFTNLKNNVDNSIRFSKIHFMSSTCYNDCPQLGIDIWEDGTYQLNAGINAAPYNGNYVGHLNKVQLDSLSYILKRSELKKMYDWQQTNAVADAPGYYFDIDFVNSKKRLTINTTQPPLNLTDLVDFMVASYQKVKLIKVNLPEN